jgi:hypothetical protein
VVRMTRLNYLLVMVTPLGCVAWFLLEYVPWPSDASIWFGSAFLVGVLTVSAFIAQKWIVLGALFLVLCTSTAGERGRYRLVVVALAIWLAMHLANYVSGIADGLLGPFKACWLALFFAAVAASFCRRWRELAVVWLTLFITFGAFVGAFLGPEKGGLLPNQWLQQTGFRIYASHLIRSMPIEEFLSRCKLVAYLEKDGTRQQIGECDDGLRSTLWFEINVIYDPSGQLGLTAVERTLPWRLAALHLPNGAYFVHADVASHLVGDFFWILSPPDLSGDNGK